MRTKARLEKMAKTDPEAAKKAAAFVAERQVRELGHSVAGGAPKRGTGIKEGKSRYDFRRLGPKSQQELVAAQRAVTAANTTPEAKARGQRAISVIAARRRRRLEKQLGLRP